MNRDVMVNNADCIQTAYHFGKSVVYNVCSGNVTDVLWGGVDWLAFAGLCAAGLLIIWLISIIVRL